jgi:Tfp pilus assembly protein PilF
LRALSATLVSDRRPPTTSQATAPPAPGGVGPRWLARWAPALLGLGLPLIFNPFGLLAFELPRAALLQTAAAGLLLTAWARPAGAGRFGLGVRSGGWLWPTTLLFLATQALATCFSIARLDSLLGSYDRSQGLLTLAAAATVGLAAAGSIARHRLADWLAAGSVPVCLYALLQHVGLDPLIWLNRAFGPASTLGSSTALAGYLTLVAPLTLTRALQRAGPATDPPAAGGLPVAAARLFFTFGLQVTVVLLSGVRGALFGLGAGLLVLGLLLAWRLQWRALARLALALGLGALLALGGLNLPFQPVEALRDSYPYLGRLGEIGGGDTGRQERLAIWQAALETILSGGPRLLWGYGPETQALALEDRFPTELANRLPDQRFDRAHAWPLDLLLTSGLAGLAAFLGLIWGATRAGLRTAGPRQGDLLAAGLLSSLAAHLVESAVAFPSVVTLCLFWVVVGGLAGGPTRGTSGVLSGPAGPRSAGPAARRLLATGLLIACLTLAASPLLADLAYRRALAYRAGEDPAGEVAWLRRATALAPYRDLYPLALAGALAERVPIERSAERRAGLLAAAERRLAQALALRAAEPYSHFDQGRLFELRAQVERQPAGFRLAAEAYATAARLSPGRATFADAQGAALLRAGQPAAALEAFQRAAQVGPPSAERSAQLGDALLALGQPDQAQASYDDALAQNPRLATAQAGLASLLAARGDLVGAAEAARRAVRYQFQDWRLREQLAGLERQLGDLDAAVEQARAAARYAPSWERERLRAEVEALKALR